MLKKTLFISNYKNPLVNLAIENIIVTDIPKGAKALLIYKNDPSIVLGRFQNPWIECDIANIKRDNIHLVRRQSGGGTVYHDLGNIN